MTSEFPPQPGGIGNHAYHLAKQFQDSGHHITVITDSRSKDDTIEKRFDEEQHFNIKRIGISSPRFLMYFRRIKALFAQIPSNEIIIATGKFSLWSTALCTWLRPIRKIAVIHGTEVNYTSFVLRSLVNLALKRFNTIIAVSHFTKHLVSHLHDDIKVIPNGIVNEDWSSISKPVWNTANVHLVTVGRISERKGQHVVVHHLPYLKEQIPNLKYHCIGLKTDSETLQKQIMAKGLSEDVIFHGVLSHEDLKKQLSKCQIFIMLSTETPSGDVEGFGIAILEANAMGIPAIGAKGSGIDDAIQHGFSGILIDGNDANALYEAIIEIQNNYKQYCQNAISWAKEHDWSAIIEQYHEVID